MGVTTFHSHKSPDELGFEDVNAYLGYFVDVRRVSADTRRQALNALNVPVFFYKQLAGTTIRGDRFVPMF